MPITRIESLDDPRIQDFRIVSDPALMRDRGLFVAEGRLAVERLLASRFRSRAVLLIDAAYERLERALTTAGPDDLDVYLTDAERLRGITGFRFHRGCLALGERPQRSAVDIVLPMVRPDRPVVVLEAVTDPDNVGAIFRNAAAFGASAVVLGPTCADPLYRKAIRTSMGTTLSLPFAIDDDWPGVLRSLRDRGAHVVALTPTDDAADLEAFVGRGAVSGPLALLLGGEGDGLSVAALGLADDRVRIEIEPAVDSLNVATAAAIALHRIRAASSGVPDPGH